MWLKLGGLALLTAALIFMISAPVATVKVILIFPTRVIPPSSSAFEAMAMSHLFAIDMTLVLVVLLTSIWIGARIVRSHMNSK